jgi:phosphoglycerate kinase
LKITIKKENKKMNNEKLKIVVIGCGRFSKFFVPLFKAHPVTEKVWVCDLKKDREEEFSNRFGVDRFESFEAALSSKEVNAVDKVMNSIVRPFTAIMGGSKVSTKIDIIENLLTKVDNLILCGGMTYTFKKAMGGTIGMSLCEDDKLELALDIMKKAKENNVNLLLAIDSVVADDFSPNANTQIVASDQIPDGWEGLDIGPKTIELFKEAIVNSKTILWNGPCGVFEMDKFAVGSKAIAEAICEATKNGAYSLIGGGDSVACINKFGLADQVSYVSTGGGALLEAIEGKVLPGIAAVQG